MEELFEGIGLKALPSELDIAYQYLEKGSYRVEVILKAFRE